MSFENIMFRITELERQMANLITIGRLTEVDYEKARCRVQIGEIETDFSLWVVARAGGDRTWEPLEVGEQVVVFSPNGDPEQAIVGGSLYQYAAPAPGASADVTRTKFQDGAVIEYDRSSSKYSINIPSGGEFSVSVGSTTFIITEAGYSGQTPTIRFEGVEGA